MELNIKKPVLGFLIFIAHLIIYIALYLKLFFGQIDILYYFLCLVWLFTIGSHLYFKECLITKTEKNLFESNDWDGLWNPIFWAVKKNNVEITQNLKDNTYICFGIVISVILIIRIVFN